LRETRASVSVRPKPANQLVNQPSRKRSLRHSKRCAKMASPRSSRNKTMRLFVEVQRRGILKVATGYLVVSWLVLEVGHTLFNVFELPNAGL
jgi:hypothetical protein